MAKATSTTIAPPAGLSSVTGFRDVLVTYVRAGYQALFVPTMEESRVEAEIVAAAQSQLASKGGTQPMHVVTWDLFEGYVPLGNSINEASLKSLVGEKYRDPVVALRLLADPALSSKLPKQCIFIFRDLDDMFQAPPVRRAIRSLCEGNRLVSAESRHPIVIISPSQDIHPKLRSHLTVVDFTLPDEAKLDDVFTFVQSGIVAEDRAKAECSPELREKVVAALLGLTSTEAENTLALCTVRHGGFVDEMLRTIKNEKAQIVRKSEVLTYLDEDHAANRNEIGGFENVLDHVRRRSRAYSRHARRHKLDFPKGIVLLGLPGTGKSMVAQALGKQMGMPVYIMDVGAVFGSLVGESEARMRMALKQIAAQQGCVLLIDEADKAWGGAHQSSGDSGVTQRVFGQLLTWLATKQDRTFVVMTMNRVKNVPAEFLRMGRFDAIFYTELPTPDARRAVLEIHLKKRGIDPASLGFTDGEWDTLVKQTDTYVPSELEELVKEARSNAYDAFCEANEGQDLSKVDDARAAIPRLEHFMTAVASIVPLAKTAQEEIAALSTFCEGRARPASQEVVRVRSRTRSVQTESSN